MAENFDFVLLACSSILIACLGVAKVFSYKKLLDEKNVQLKQFYLDGKFLYKNLVDSITISSTSEFCSRLLKCIERVL